ARTAPVAQVVAVTGPDTAVTSMALPSTVSVMAVTVADSTAEVLVTDTSKTTGPPGSGTVAESAVFDALPCGGTSVMSTTALADAAGAPFGSAGASGPGGRTGSASWPVTVTVSGTTSPALPATASVNTQLTVSPAATLVPSSAGHVPWAANGAPPSTE